MVFDFHDDIRLDVLQIEKGVTPDSGSWNRMALVLHVHLNLMWQGSLQPVLPSSPGDIVDEGWAKFQRSFQMHDLARWTLHQLQTAVPLVYPRNENLTILAEFCEVPTIPESEVFPEMLYKKLHLKMQTFEFC